MTESDSFEDASVSAGTVASLVGLEALAVVLLFGSIRLVEISRRGSFRATIPDGVAVVGLVVLVAACCVGPSFAVARRLARRDAGQPSRARQKTLARRSVGVHIALVFAWTLSEAWSVGAGFVIAAALVVVPSALVAYAATRVGLALGARRRD